MTAEPIAADVREVRPPMSRPRWRQFSLRTLLLAMFVLSVCFALFAWRLQRARRQAAAVATIRKLGGNITYDYQRDPVTGRWRKQPKSAVPTWLLKSLGVDFFHDVILSTMNSRQPESAAEVQAYWSAINQLRRIDLLQADDKWVDGRTTTDALRHHRHLRELWLMYGNLRGSDLEPLSALENLETLYVNHNPIGDDGANRLASFPKLKNLTLSKTQIGDACLAKLATNSNLEVLRLGSTKVSDRGVAHLTALTKLKTLGLADTRITDESLRELAKLKELESLSLFRTDISDDGLAQLAPLAKLQTLDVPETRVSGAAFKELRSLTNLERLQLGGDQVTDEGAQWAMQMPRLRHVTLEDAPLTMKSLGHIEWPSTLETISLAGTGLTDDGLMRLAKCPNLRSVGISGTKVTTEGIKRFQQVRPGVNVH